MVIRKHLFFHTRIHKYIGNILVLYYLAIICLFFPGYAVKYALVFIINIGDKINHIRWDF